MIGVVSVHKREGVSGCPDCGGALRQSQLGTLKQFRCHIGHVYTAEVMLHRQFIAMEQSLETALRSMNERAELCRQMESLKQSGAFTIGETALAAIRSEFLAGRSVETDTARTIRETLAESGYLLDPHTATAVKVARQQGGSPTPMVVLATAHPAKFPDAVKAASGVTPALPAWLSDLMERKEHFTVLPSEIKMVEDHISRHTRAAR